MSANRFARRMMWEALKENYGALTKRFEGNFSLSRLIEYSFSELADEKDAADVNTFFSDKDVSIDALIFLDVNCFLLTDLQFFSHLLVYS